MINGISGMSPWSAYGVYGASYANRAAQAQEAEKAQSVQRPSAVWTARKAAQPDAPVQPVTAVRPVDGNEQKPGRFALSLREGADPVEMAVRMRIKYMGDDPAGQKSALGADQLKDPALENTKSPQEVMEEGECQTCKERKYQDGSDDSSVSYQTPTHIDADYAPAAVRGHELEHVAHEQAKAQREDRKVVSQTVTLHTDICPECGRVYVSGGTTRTVTKADNTEAPAREEQDGAEK